MKKKLLALFLSTVMCLSPVNVLATETSSLDKVKFELTALFDDIDAAETQSADSKILFVTAAETVDPNSLGEVLGLLQYQTWFDYDYVSINLCGYDAPLVSVVLDVKGDNGAESHVWFSESLNSSSQTNTTEPPTNETIAPLQSLTRYDSGMYKVGVDIPSGEYVVFANSGMGYFCVSSDSNGDDIIQNANFDYNSIITLSDGQYFELSRCYAIPVDEVKELDMSGTGFFKVGTHLSPGEYKLIADGMGYYCIYDSSTQQNIISNNNFEGNQYVTVSNGQYLELDRCHFETVPTAPQIIISDTETVKKVQEQLNLLGYDCGTPDGAAGPATQDAIKKFQTDKGADATGVITSALLQLLGL